MVLQILELVEKKWTKIQKPAIEQRVQNSIIILFWEIHTVLSVFENKMYHASPMPNLYFSPILFKAIGFLAY